MNAPADHPTASYQVLRPHRSEFIQLRGLRHHLLRWDAHDAAAAASNPPLVLLHGWMDVGASFQFMVDALQVSAQRQIFAIDWRGFGLSDSSGADAYWFPDYLGDLDALLNLISPSVPVDLLGHSMGGNVVMTYAALRPQRIRRLINLEGFGLPETRAEQAPERLLEWLDQLKAPQSLKSYPSQAAVAARLMKTNPRLPADKAAWLAAHWARPAEDGSWHILGDPVHKRSNPILYRKDEIVAGWARIQAPLLWVEGACTDLSAWWGDRYPRADFEARLSVVKQIERQVLADAGHMLHHDQPQALAEVLETFLS
ncbi:alpha/beta fold hydrolase [Paucibacter sp. Y2R2-4]|uniref:alpha/beta fold hydrolase n=1 Tax=Paucibacter sp. Y2R2-4 TaxID=2893553 RepID=UPI0021E38790|nr:alpha/beta hydrolase [Paucibacter sp. Y2R2-4]MCV2349140.1 alpha/beta hydrolase [Paucibacter sp. Y2R2-4]